MKNIRIAMIMFAAIFGPCEALAGVNFIRNEAGRPGLMIFLHGITGNSDTWSNRQEGGPSWLDIIYGDRLFNDMNIISYNYPTALTGDGLSTMGVAQALKADLENPEVGINRYDRIVIVGHSLGGIVARQYILLLLNAETRNASDPSRGVRSKIRGLFLFGTPMSGSAIADIAVELLNYGGIFITSSSQLRELRSAGMQTRMNTYLEQLRLEWIRRRVGMDIPSFCAFETGKVYRFFTVVPAANVEPLCTSDMMEIGENHTNLVKPPSGEVRQFYTHTILRSWYRSVFPFSSRNEQDEVGDIVLADCSSDRYGPDFSGAVSRTLIELDRGSPRLTSRLPINWQPAYAPLLRLENARLLIIHLSCFEVGSNNNSVAQNVARTEQIVSLLQTIRDYPIKILIYSRAFTEGTAFLDQYRIVRELRSAGRLTTFAFAYSAALADEAGRRRFRDTLDRFLN